MMIVYLINSVSCIDDHIKVSIKINHVEILMAMDTRFKIIVMSLRMFQKFFPDSQYEKTAN